MEKISQKNKIRSSIFMLQNRLIITEKTKRKAIYENSKDKWIIDFEDKIKSWSDFYDIVQKEMDFWNYNEKFRKEWNASIDIEVYILIDDNSIKDKNIDFDNELIIATENDRNDVRQQYKNYDKTKIRFFDYDEIKDLPNIFLDNKRGSEAERFIFFYQLEKIKADNSKQLKVEISNSMRIFHSLNIYLLVYIIDKILIEKFIEGKEIKMFMIFANELAE